MRERTLVKKVWRIILPILLYEIFTILYSQLLGMIAGKGLLVSGASMWILTGENFLMLPVFWLLYRQDQKRRSQENGIRGGDFQLKEFFYVIPGAVCLSRGVNFFLALTPLPYWFPGYEAVSEEIYTCSLLSQIAATVISAPLLEEVLMRGLFYSRLKEETEMPRIAMLASALAFGLFHGSVVQGTYAFVLGLFFVWMYEAGQSLLPAVLAHAAANGASVLAGQMKAPAVVYEIPGVYCLLTAGYLFVGIFCWKQIASRHAVKLYPTGTP